MIKALVHGAEYEIEFIENKPVLKNGNAADIFEIEAGKSYHLLLNNKSQHVQILDYDRANKTCTMRVNNKHFEVSYKDRYDVLLNILGIDNASAHFVNHLKAPMPGLVLKVLVEVGQEIKKGDSAILLEAMKMENVIKSPGDGKVKAILVKEKQAVEKNQNLLELE
jgi:biotin carboxyl carrier protein